MAKQETKDLAAKQSAELTAALLQSNDGLDDLGAEDLEIPLLKMYNDSSQKAKIGNHEEGTIVHTISQEPVNDLWVVPLTRRRTFIVWPLPRKMDCFPEGVYSNVLDIPNEFQDEGKYAIDRGFEYYFMVEGMSLPCVMRMVSSAEKVAKSLNTMEMDRKAGQMTPGRYIITSQHKKNDKGEWFVPKFNPVSKDQPLTNEELSRIVELRMMLATATFKVHDGDATPPASPSEKVTDDVPF